MASLEHNSPLRYHRSFNMIASPGTLSFLLLTLSAITTIEQVVQSIVGSESDQSIKFSLVSPPTPAEKSANLFSVRNIESPILSSEIVDLNYEIETREPKKQVNSIEIH